MSEVLFENTKVASYFLWEYTKHDNALALWYCAEEIAYYMETQGYCTMSDIIRLKGLSKWDHTYISFVRHIAFRIYIYTMATDAMANWFIAERLLDNAEWCAAITRLAEVYSKNKNNFNLLTGVRSDQVKKYYSRTHES